MTFLAEHESGVFLLLHPRRSQVESLKEHFMKSSTKDQVEGTLHELKGKVKEAAGKLKRQSAVGR